MTFHVVPAEYGTHTEHCRALIKIVDGVCDDVKRTADYISTVSFIRVTTYRLPRTRLCSSACDRNFICTSLCVDAIYSWLILDHNWL